MMGIAMLVERVERGSDAGAIARRDRLDADGNLQREFLADVAQVEMDLTLRLRGMAQRRRRLRHHLVVDVQQSCEVDGGKIAIKGADEVVPFVCQQQAERA